MRVLVTYGSKRGGTAGIAGAVARTLSERGLDAEVRPAERGMDVGGYDAFVVGGALYAGRWHRGARRFVRRHAGQLRAEPTWFFSSGPLDGSASDHEIPPVRGVARLMARVGAVGHVTFGGRLPAEARGFPAAAMAKDRAGDWRDWERIAAWAGEVASELGAPAAAA